MTLTVHYIYILYVYMRNSVTVTVLLTHVRCRRFVFMFCKTPTAISWTQLTLDLFELRAILHSQCNNLYYKYNLNELER